MPKELTKTKYYLGVDYGESKIGLAIADSETQIAFAYGVVANDKNFFKNILDIIKKEKIEQVIIGIPARINHKETAYAGEKLGQYLGKTAKISVEYQDEMYSTKIARENLKEKGLRDINRFDDAESARIILNSWMEKRSL
ncbi:MAG: Holliday junction resolvase RuvX [Candidatus Moraniibacteriota bacterium]|jgi:putative Holliday junction resolvase